MRCDGFECTPAANIAAAFVSVAVFVLGVFKTKYSGSDEGWTRGGIETLALGWGCALIAMAFSLALGSHFGLLPA